MVRETSHPLHRHGTPTTSKHPSKKCRYTEPTPTCSSVQSSRPQPRHQRSPERQLRSIPSTQDWTQHEGSSFLKGGTSGPVAPIAISFGAILNSPRAMICDGCCCLSDPCRGQRCSMLLLLSAAACCWLQLWTTRPFGQWAQWQNAYSIHTTIKVSIQHECAVLGQSFELGQAVRAWHTLMAYMACPFCVHGYLCKPPTTKLDKCIRRVDLSNIMLL